MPEVFEDSSDSSSRALMPFLAVRDQAGDHEQDRRNRHEQIESQETGEPYDVDGVVRLASQKDATA